MGLKCTAMSNIFPSKGGERIPLEPACTPTEITDFERLLQLHPKRLPENRLISAVQQQQQLFTQQMATANGVLKAQPTDPRKVVALQYTLIQNILAVELCSKLAGSFTQSANRLVNLQ